MTTFTQQQKYAFLNEQKIAQYVKDLELFPQEAELHVVEISDGKINHVFRIYSEEHSVIYKQAVPYARTVGEDMPLPLERVRVEAEVLQQYEKILAGSVPAVLHLDTDLAILITEDMAPLEVGRTALLNDTESTHFAKDIGAFMATTMFYTSDFYLDSSTKKQKIQQFINAGMTGLTEELTFDRPYQVDESNFFEESLHEDVLWLSQDSKLHLEVAKLKRRFQNTKDALIHGDLHSGAIMLETGRTVVFDTEFACYGPFGFDLGQFVANLWINGIGKQTSKYDRYRQSLEVWYAFVERFTALWRTEAKERYTMVDGYLTAVLDEIREDMFGFAGCELIRRAIGIAQIPDLNHESDKNKRAANRRESVELGKYLIFNRQSIQSIEQLADWFKA